MCVSACIVVAKGGGGGSTVREVRRSKRHDSTGAGCGGEGVFRKNGF